LTDKFEEEVMIELAKIEAIGGATVAVDQGYFTESLSESSFRWHQKVERKEKTVVGVNEFIVEEENETEIFLADPTVEKRQRERLQEVRARRDARQVEATLAAVRAAAERGDNLIPTLVEAVEAYASIGEICAELRVVYGEYRQVG
jgi:methylmalonyl-CoA mutase N-terminal domain/subunit